MGIAKVAIDGVWGKIMKIDPSKEFKTPAERSTFNVVETNQDGLTIRTSGGSPVPVTKDAFESALAYLLSHAHFDHTRPCEIRSNKDYEMAGPLCRSTREPKGTMTITYILPILEAMGLVGIDPSIPSSTWPLA